MISKNILIVEDDEDINKILSELLKNGGYNTTSAYSGTEAMIHLNSNKFDMIILDLMLPGLSGEDILEKVRAVSNIFIIVISAKNEVKLKSSLLRLGADDYITKPFDNEEVLARVQANLRRCSVEKNEEVDELRFKDIVLDKNSKSIKVASQNITLTNKEYKIIELMLSNQSKIFSKANLFEAVWNEEYAYDDNTINVHISNIRNKFKKANKNEEYIETIWGMGYKLI